MSYQVLARKWRPKSFKEMVGQEHILRMLTNALDHQRLHHAYLFTGTRGVGKTTLARIFAKCLNCETGITSQPCDSCKTCQAIDAGKFLDLIEVDAASRTKVEDTRELLENVQYPPSQGRYKIYLIDEVHMLSGHSFNALLKTLEEPPHYVKFLLATTDPKRLPITILSRCLQFNLKSVAVEKIIHQLTKICGQENIESEASALQLIAQAADGSMRDALSLLDQTIAYCHGKINIADTQQMLGSVEKDNLFRLLNTLITHDGNMLLTEISLLNEHVPNYSQVLEEMLSILHQISVAQVIPDTTSDERIKKFASLFSAEEIQLYYQIALIGRRDLSYTPSSQQGFEMIMLRMFAFKPIHSNNKMNLENSSAPVKKPEVLTQQETTSHSANWPEILPKLGLTGMAYALASNCSLTQLTQDKVELILSHNHAPMLNKKLSDRIEQSLNQHFNRTVKLTITPASTELSTPAKQQLQANEARQNKAAEAIKNDNHVQKIMDLFDATLDINSVQAVDPLA